MATVSSPEIVKDILRSMGKNEWGAGEIDWKLIYSYKSKIKDELLFALFDDAKHDDMYSSPFVCDQILLMRNGKLTKDGAEFLGVNQDEFNNNDGCGGKYYRTVIQVEILSNDPYEFISLEDTACDIMNGDCSGRVNVVSVEEVNSKVMSQLLISHGSDPAFLLSDEDLEEYDKTL